MDKILLPRPTRESALSKRLVTLDVSPARCQYCGEDIVPCGFECVFGHFVHSSGPRPGSHKCGIKFGDRDASP